MAHEFVIRDGEEFCFRCRMTQQEIADQGVTDCWRILCAECDDDETCVHLGYCRITGGDL